MMKTLITTTNLTLGLGLFSAPSFATGYVVNGHAAPLCCHSYKFGPPLTARGV
jgi:hypothetical protein